MALRKDFNGNANFKVLVGFTLYGVPYERGQDFDRSSVPVRLLRQLYDNRNLEMAEEPDRRANFEQYLKGVNPLSLMTVEELTKFLADRGVTPRYNSTRVQL